jgi:hypothetical protein
MGTLQLPGNISSRSLTISRKTFCEGIGKWIQVIRVAIMTKVPDRSDFKFLHGSNHGIDAGEIIHTLLIYHGPWNAFPAYGYTQPAEKLVILPGEAVVLRFGNQVPAAFIFPEESGALESGEKKGWKDAGLFGHACLWTERV